LCCIVSAQEKGTRISLRAEYSKTLIELCNTIVELQVKEPTDSNCGAIQCLHCSVYHTRASESVYPLFVSFTITGDKKYLEAAKSTASWLFRQQEKDGSWKETPEEWTGTSTDQLLMLAETYDGIKQHLTDAERTVWLTTMTKAADYLVRVMTPEWASINYVATTTATLARVNRVVPDARYLSRARELAHRTISKIDEGGFLTGEGGRNHEDKYGVDLGYNMEMSLWGLAYYARTTGDKEVEEAVRQSLRTHVYFIYPDGSLDASWGIRSNKWTTFGSATSDGCQVLFTLFADEQPYYATAAYKNLEYLRMNMKNGYIGYGPHYWKLFSKPPCIYPTFTKAKNLALAYSLESKASRTLAPLPTDKPGWIKYFPTVQVAEVRTKNLMATMSAYTYKDIEKKEKSKYMFRPSGGSISNLWVEGYGLLQASSQTFYARWEPMSFPVVDTVICLTPRIEYRNKEGYFTNLFGIFASAVIVPFVAFFLLKDGEQMKKQVIELVPNRYFEMTLTLFHRVTRQLSAYLRGTMLDCGITAVLYIIGYSIIGVKYSILVGFLGGVLCLVPYLGPWMGAALAMVIMLFDPSASFPWWSALIVASLVQFFENNFLYPIILGKSVDIHPLIIMFGLFVGAEVAGLVGMVLAVPLIAILKVIAEVLYKGLRQFSVI